MVITTIVTFVVRVIFYCKIVENIVKIVKVLTMPILTLIESLYISTLFDGRINFPVLFN